MNTGKREAELLRLLTDADGTLRLDAAAQKLGVSEKTVRRDLARLDQDLAPATKTAAPGQRPRTSLSRPVLRRPIWSGWPPVWRLPV